MARSQLSVKVSAAARARLLAIAAALVAAYAFLGFILVPSFLKRAIVQDFAKYYGRTISVRSVGFNPFTMTAELDGYRIDDTKGGPFFSGDKASAHFLPFASLSRHEMAFGEVALLKPDLRIIRNADGSLNLSDLPPMDWQKFPDFSIGLARLVDGRLTLLDSAIPGGFSTTLYPLTLELRNFSKRADRDAVFSLEAVSELGERLSGKGSFRLDPMSSRGEIDADKIQIRKYYPYFKNVLSCLIASGTVTARIPYAIDLAASRLKAGAHDASLSLSSLKLAEGASGARMLELADLAIGGVAVDLPMRTVAAASLRVNGVSASVRRQADGSLNIQHILAPVRKPAATAGWKLSLAEISVTDFDTELQDGRSRASLGWKKLAVSAPTLLTKPLGATVGSIALSEGRLGITDSSVAPSVSLSLTGLGIKIGGFSSSSPALANVAISAVIDDTAQLQVYGQSNPLRGIGATRLRALVQGFDLTVLRPYAAKYLGYELKGGQLRLDGAWSVQGRKLGARNTIEIDDLSLGGKMASKDAVNLPLRLAVALIKDSRGRITLDVPISGTLDDPKFDPAKTFLDALFSPLIKTASSPFTAFGAKLGVGGEELAFQEFSPGSSELSPEGIAKLRTVLEGLRRWPELMLDITGSVDPKKDAGDPRLLAAARAQAVRDYLLGTGGLEPGRVFLVDDASREVPSAGSRALLALQEQYVEPRK